MECLQYDIAVLFSMLDVGVELFRMSGWECFKESEDIDLVAKVSFVSL